MKLIKYAFVSAVMVTLIGLTYVSFDGVSLSSTPIISENKSVISREKDSRLDFEINYDTIEREMLALLKEGKHESILDHYSKYLTKDNIHSGFFNAYGVACVKLDKFEAAYYAFKRSFLLDIDDLVVFYNLISMAYRTERHSIAHGLSEIYITVTKDNPKYLKQRKLIKEVFNSTKNKPEDQTPVKNLPTYFV